MPGLRAPDPGHRARVGRAVATDRQEACPVAGLCQPRLDVRRQPPEVRDDQVAVLCARIRVGDPARVVGSVAVVQPCGADECGSPTQAIPQPSVPQLRGSAIHPREMPTQRGRRASDHDRAIGHAMQDTGADT